MFGATDARVNLNPRMTGILPVILGFRQGFWCTGILPVSLQDPTLKKYITPRIANKVP